MLTDQTTFKVPDLEPGIQTTLIKGLNSVFQWLQSYPFPSLRCGAVVAMTTCIPSGHHSNWVESLAYWQKIMDQHHLTNPISGILGNGLFTASGIFCTCGLLSSFKVFLSQNSCYNKLQQSSNCIALKLHNCMKEYLDFSTWLTAPLKFPNPAKQRSTLS